MVKFNCEIDMRTSTKKQKDYFVANIIGQNGNVVRVFLLEDEVRKALDVPFSFDLKKYFNKEKQRQ